MALGEKNAVIMAVAAPQPGHLAALTVDGQLSDSGKTPEDFAPAGFGLGNGAIPLSGEDDLNKLAGKNGWYHWEETPPLNAPPESWGIIRTCCDLCVIGQTQRAISLHGGIVMQRHYSTAQGWSVWECENPPLQLEVEYRTTKRYQGKPIYAKLVNYGTLPGVSSSYVTIAEDVERIFIDPTRSIVFKTEQAESGYYNLLPIECGILQLSGSYRRINITTNSSTYAAWSAFICCHYTKIAD